MFGRMFWVLICCSSVEFTIKSMKYWFPILTHPLVSWLHTKLVYTLVYLSPSALVDTWESPQLNLEMFGHRNKNHQLEGERMFKPRTILLWGDNANLCNSMLLICIYTAYYIIFYITWILSRTLKSKNECSFLPAVLCASSLFRDFLPHNPVAVLVFISIYDFLK